MGNTRPRPQLLEVEADPPHAPKENQKESLEIPQMKEISNPWFNYILPRACRPSPIDFEIEDSGRGNFHATCLLSPEDTSQEWTVISHGLLRVHQGTRSIVIDEMEETVLLRALRDLWNDIALPARLHFILPSPEEGPCIHVIIEFLDDSSIFPQGTQDLSCRSNIRIYPSKQLFMKKLLKLTICTTKRTFNVRLGATITARFGLTMPNCVTRSLLDFDLVLFWISM